MGFPEGRVVYLQQLIVAGRVWGASRGGEPNGAGFTAEYAEERRHWGKAQKPVLPEGAKGQDAEVSVS